MLSGLPLWHVVTYVRNLSCSYPNLICTPRASVYVRQTGVTEKAVRYHRR